MTTHNEELQTEKVQLWQNGIMAGVIPRDDASELLKEGKYELINAQAIEWRGELR